MFGRVLQNADCDQVAFRGEVKLKLMGVILGYPLPVPHGVQCCFLCLLSDHKWRYSWRQLLLFVLPYRTFPVLWLSGMFCVFKAGSLILLFLAGGGDELLLAWLFTGLKASSSFLLFNLNCSLRPNSVMPIPWL